MRGVVVGLTSALYFAVDVAGNLYLPDGTEGSALVKIAPDGRLLAHWAGLEVVEGQPDTIVGIAIEPGTGDVFVTDTTADLVVHLTPDLVMVASWGSTGPGPGQFSSPGGIAIDPEGHVLVADMGNDRIETFTRDGTWLEEWGSPGGPTGPVDLTTDRLGNIYVSAVLPVSLEAAGATAGQVTEYSSGHDAVLTLGTEGAMRPLYPDAAVDTDGNIYVADAVQGLVKYAPDGSVVDEWAIPGPQWTAAAVRVAPSGNVYTVACADLDGDCQIAEFTPTGRLVASWHSAETVTPPGAKVDVGGHGLYLQCAGTGSPTIVWEAGGGSSGWFETAQYLMGRLSFISRVCVYDRLGYGYSDPRADDDFFHWSPSVGDLHALLQAADVAAPYVIAGFSYGGLLARLYAYTYPGEVLGLVAVDPSHEDQFAGPPTPDSSHGFTTCTDARCPVYADIQAIHALTHGEVAGSLGALPLVVLGRAAPFWASAEYDAYWEELGAETATASSNSVHVVASWSSHLIPYSQPGLVIEAVREVVAAARAPDHTLTACGSAFTDLGGLCQ